MRSRTVLVGLAVLGTTALVGVGGAAHAVAPPELIDEGLWYYTRTSIADAHQRTTGEGITIAVMDTVINPQAPDLVGADLQVRPSTCQLEPGSPPNDVGTGEDAEHATAIAALLVGTGAGVDGQRGVQGVAPGATVLSYSQFPAGWDPDDLDRESCVGSSPLAPAIDQAVADGVDIITLSSANVWSATDGAAVARAYAAGVIVVGSADNDGGPLGFPGKGNGVVSVEMFDAAGELDPVTTEDEFLAVVAPGESIRIPTPGPDGSWNHYRLANGTSYATPWVAGVLALGWSLYPDATANQMIQSLVRNTATDSPDLTHDEQWGYGGVSVSRFLDADPTQYPDENPLVHPYEDELDVPRTSEILAAYEAAGTPATTAEPTEPTAEPTASAPPAVGDGEAQTDTTPDEATPSVLPAVLGGAALLLIAAAAVAVAVRRRSQQPSATPERTP